MAVCTYIFGHVDREKLIGLGHKLRFGHDVVHLQLEISGKPQVSSSALFGSCLRVSLRARGQCGPGKR